MSKRVLVPFVAAIGLLVGCGDDGESLLSGDGASDTGVEDTEGTTVETPSDTGVETTRPPIATDGPLESTPPIDDGGDPAFTLPTLPDDPTGGGGDTSGDLEEDVVDMFAQEFSTDPMFSEEDGRCIGQQLVDELGIEGIEEVGAVGNDPAQWPPEVLDTLMDAMWGCIDFESLLTEQIMAGGATQEQADCVWDAVPEDQWQEILMEVIMDPSSTVVEDTLTEQASHCR